MPRQVLIALGVMLLAFVGLSVTAFTMSPMMDDWHWRMMGGRGSDPAGEAPVEGVTAVRIADFAFVPTNIVVDAGTTVTWTNEDGVEHTVTSDEGGELDSELLDQGETYRHTFETPGAYAYYCKPHPYMKGLVTVRAAGG